MDDYSTADSSVEVQIVTGDERIKLEISEREAGDFPLVKVPHR